MYDITYYFISPNKASSSTKPTGRPAALQRRSKAPPATAPATVMSTAKVALHMDVAAVASSSSSSSSSAPHSPCVNSKLIVENMASVISSVEKQQRRAKRKRRDAAASTDEPEISDISTILSSSLRFVSPNASGSLTTGASVETAEAAEAEAPAVDPCTNIEEAVNEVAEDNGSDNKSAKPSRSTSHRSTNAGRSGTVATKTKRRSHKENTNSGHRTPSASPPNVLVGVGKNAKSPLKSTATSTAGAVTPKKNAFEMLMNARNKVIGTNSPAKDASTPAASGTGAAVSAGSAEPECDSAIKTKRKLLLEEWSDRKGATKRRVHDDEAEEYVNKQMAKRAKRLKRLLANGKRSDERPDEGSGSEAGAGEADTNDEDALVDVDQSNELNGSYVKFNFKKFGKARSARKARKSKLQVFDSDEENTSERTPVVEWTPVEVIDTVESDTCQSAAPTILTALRSPPPTKSPHKPARQKSIYLPKTPTKSPRTSVAKVVPMDAIDQLLASPIKKRDSLLGYFNKVDKSPVDADALCAVSSADVAEPKPVARKRGRPSKKSGIQRISVDRPQTPSPTVGLTADAPAEATPDASDESALRPMRGCRSKAVSYTSPAAESTERSAATISAQKSIKRARRLLSGGSPQKCGSPGRTPRTATAAAPTTKLASIFCKAPPRVIIDPATARARQEFLMSGIPAKMRQDIERQKAVAETYACELDVFPLVSHVTQLPPNAEAAPPAVLPPLRYRRDETVDTSTTQYKVFQLGAKAAVRTQPTDPTAGATLASMNALKLTRPKDLVKQLKEHDSSKFLYFRGYKQVRRMFDEHQAAAPLRTAVPNGPGSCIDDASNDSDIEIVEPSAANEPPTAANGNAMFTEKYKPIICDEIVVNSAPAFQLKKFLDTWLENYTLRNSNSGARHRRNGSANTDSDDGDDFEGGSSTGSAALNTAICLVGPTGVGKTNAVYAVANELNFKVLEINAGCKRTGRKMLLELQEATQSHLVKSGTGGNNTGERLFRSASSEESSSASAAVAAGPTKLSLILIEDADIVFEQDNGFIDAIFQLVATSKRPVILVANQRSCAHLARLIGANAIHFEPANVAHAGKWLSLLSIAEHQYVGHVDCSQLYVHNGRNMRRTVLDMQFFLQSGGDRCRHPDGQYGRHYAHQRLFETFARPATAGGFLTLPVDFDCIHDKTEEILRVDAAPAAAADDGSSLSDVLAFLESMSVAQRLQACDRRRRGDNNDGLTWNMAEEVAFDVAEGMLMQRRRRGASKFSIDPPPVGRSEGFGQSVPLLAANFAAAGLAHSCAIRRVVRLDVEPCLRSMCRSERQRTQSERNNRRFYHYLRNACFGGNTFSSAETFDRHCKVLWDGATDTGDCQTSPDSS